MSILVRTVATPVVAAAVTLTAPATANAQLSSAAGVGAVIQRQGGGFWQSLTRVDPALRLANPWLQLGARSSMASDARSTRLDSAAANFLVQSPAWNGFRLSTTAEWARRPVDAGFATSEGYAESAVAFETGSRGAWAGLASERSAGNALGAYGDGLARFGLWQRIGPISLVVSSAQHSARGITRGTSLSGIPTDTGRVDTLHFDRSSVRRWSDAEARLLWSVGRVAMDGQFGYRRGTDSAHAAMWGRATATYALADRLSLVGSFGTRAAQSWTGVPSARFATLGVRIAPAALTRPPAPVHVQPSAAAFALRQKEQGMYVATIRVPNARTVELSGDFNEWRAISLRETMPDVWEATLALRPGTYHVNLRVNGAAWTAPPGLAETSDDFNGSVGLLVVR